MSNKQIYEIVSKPWLNTSDIMLLANCGRNSAIKLRKNIEIEVEKSGKKLPQSSPLIVPSKKVLEYLGMDIDYIYDMALKEKQLI